MNFGITGALIVDGGVGIGGAVHVGDSLVTTGSFLLGGNGEITGDLTLSDGRDGALRFNGSGENSIKIPDNQATSLIIEEADDAYMTFITTDNSEKVKMSGGLDVTGNVNFDATTASSSATTGALVVDGGVGVAGNVNIAGDLNASGSVSFSGGDLVIDGTNKIGFGGSPGTDYIQKDTDLKLVAAADITLDPAGFNVLPGSNNEDALGSVAFAWSDLFLGDGAVIYFDEDDMTITNASNELQIDDCGNCKGDCIETTEVLGKFNALI